MPLPKRLARFNRVVTNRVLGPVASRAPGLGVVRHVGRTTGRSYRTPVNVFRRDDGYVVALMYGSGTDWVRNVLAAGACDLETRGRVEHLVEPERYVDEDRAAVPALVRPFVGLAGVKEFLALHRHDNPPPR